MTAIRRLRDPWVLVGIIREEGDDTKPVVGVVAVGMVHELCGVVTWRRGQLADEDWSPNGAWFSPMGRKVMPYQTHQADALIPREPPWENWPTSPGVALIAEERERQVREEGYTVEHDDRHTDFSMARAAACYAMAAAGRSCMTHLPGPGSRVGDAWPWDRVHDKRGRGADAAGRLRDLVKAGALLAAEADRLLRAQAELDGRDG